MKGLVYAVIIIIVGALFGTFLGKLIVMMFPNQGSMRNLFATQMAMGLQPTTLDLMVVKLTFGCMFDVSIMTIIGIVLAAVLSKIVFK